MSNTIVINDETPRVQYTATAAQTVFPYPFVLFDDDDVVVIVDGVTKTISTHYTVSGVAAEDGGNITFLSGQTAGAIVTIYRDMPFDRLTNYQNNSKFVANTVDRDFDRMILMIQQINETVGRGLHVSIDDTQVSLTLPSASERALKLLGFGVSGTPIASAPSAVTVASGSAIQSVNSVIAAKALTGLANNQFIKLTGYYAENDGGGGDLIYSSASSATADNGMVFALDSMPGRLLRLLNGQPRNVRMFGAKGDAVTNDLPAFNAAVASFGPNLGMLDNDSYIGGELIIPRTGSTFGGYFLNGTWKPRKYMHVRGEQSGPSTVGSATTLLFPANTDALGLESFQVSGTSDPQTFKMSDLSLRCLSKVATGRGIYSSVRFYLENVNISGFAGHGVEITGGGGAGNSDSFSLHHVGVRDCGGDGFKISGSDAQIGTFYQCDASNNAGWGFNDVASYGNAYYECHSSGNTLGSFRAITSVTYFGNYYFRCYVEFGPTATPSFDENVVVLGGTLQAVAGAASGIGFRTPGGFGPNVPTGGIHMWFVNLAEKMRLTAANVLQGMAGVNVTGGTAGTSTNINEYQTVSTGIVTSAQNHHVFVNPNGTVGTISVSGSATAYNTSSDRDLKENPQPIVNALDLADQYNPVTFEWKADGSPSRGFIADELQLVNPQAVTGEYGAVDEEGKRIYQQADYSKVVPDLMAMVKELKARLLVLELK